MAAAATMNTHPLAKELETYKTLLPSLTKEEGKFALIHGEELVGVYEGYQDALLIGYERFGVNPFLVKKISAVEQVQFFSRDLLTECLT